MATDKLINQTQGDDIIDALSDIATNVGNITYGPQTSADKVVSMIGYAEAAEAASINPGDTLNEAIGKLEKKSDDNATAVADKIDKVTNPTTGAIATLTATGEVADSEVTIAKNATGVTDDDTKVPTSKAVKTYVDSTATGISRYIGTITAASQLSTSAKKGDFYVVKTAWSGVHAGDEIIAEKDNPSQTIDGTNWSLLHNEADTDTTYEFAEGSTNGEFTVKASSASQAQGVKVHGLNSAAYTTADTSSLTNDNNHVPTSALAKTLLDDKVPTTRKVNNKALSSDITLSASDVSAVPTGNVTTTLPASSAAASTSKVMSEKLVYDTYVPNSDFVVAKQDIQLIKEQTMRNHLSMTDGTYTATASGQKSVNIPLTPITGDVVVCFGSLTSTDTDGTQCVCVFKDAAGTVLDSVRSNRGSNVSVQGHLGSSIATLMELYPAYSYQQASSDTVTWSDGMVIEKELYDIDPSYQPYAAPNFELTVLEASDRVALAEVVDSGAKNLFTINQAATSTQAGNRVFFEDNMSLPAGTYVFSFTENASSVPSSGNVIQFSLTYSDSTTDTMPYITATAKTRLVVTYTFAKQVKSIGIYVGYAGSTLIDIMCCTKAAFGVSSKFVPYRPNWDLVCNRLSSAERRVITHDTSNSSYNYHGYKFKNARGTGIAYFMGNGYANGAGTVTFSYQTTQNSVYVDKKMVNPSYVKFYHDSSAFYVVFYTSTKWDAIAISGTFFADEVEEYFSNTEIPTGATLVTETAYPTT